MKFSRFCFDIFRLFPANIYRRNSAAEKRRLSARERHVQQVLGLGIGRRRVLRAAEGRWTESSTAAEHYDRNHRHVQSHSRSRTSSTRHRQMFQPKRRDEKARHQNGTGHDQIQHQRPPRTRHRRRETHSAKRQS